MTRLYLTTPLYYVNAKPHLGHAYTTVVADCLSRAHRQQGEEVFLLTGTDEHGEKIAQAASAAGLSSQAFADQTSKQFKSLWALLGISYDHFIRTTDASHVRGVQEALKRLQAGGLLRKGVYTFWYCVPCETSWTLGDFKDSGKKICPACQRPAQEVTEEDYFLDLEAHRPWLRSHIENHPEFIRPPERRNEVLALLAKPLPELCVTRPRERVPWGIEVPFSAAHVTYVWFDALLNYLTALGWPGGEKFQSLWRPAGAIHLIGKDILRHHALYWPILLRALGEEPPKTIFAHGWWLIPPPPAPAAEGGPALGGRPEGPGSGGGVRGEKISKSKGNIVDPQAVVEAFGLDAFRYFLLRDVSLGEDGVFSEGALRARLNADLANDLGNLVYRTLTMLEKHAEGRIPPGGLDPEVKSEIWECQKNLWGALTRMAPDQALKALWVLINQANSRIERSQPWTLARQAKRKELEGLLYSLAETLRAIALLLWPFLPTTAESIARQLGLKSPLNEERLPGALSYPIPSGGVIAKEKPLFPRLD